MPVPSDQKRLEEDRRRSSRFSCGGQAKISWLPSNGIFSQGTIRDLSLHGCCIEIPPPMDRGVRAELLMRVNDASFRAVGEVRVIRGGSGAGIEFVHLSAGGKDLLSDLMSELARWQAIIKKIKSARRESDADSFRKQVEDGNLQAMMLSKRFPLLGTMLSAENAAEEKTNSASDPMATKAEAITPLVVSVNLFV